MVGYYGRTSNGGWFWRIMHDSSEVSSGTCENTGAMKEVLETYDMVDWEIVYRF